MTSTLFMTLEEKQQAYAEAGEWYARESTGFVTITGSTVHKSRLIGTNVYTACGSDGGNTTGKKSVNFVEGPCTCKRCNK
jgi:hypothetical protein